MNFANGGWSRRLSGEGSRLQHVFLYSDSLSWGIIPETRQRLEFDQRWPGVLENNLTVRELRVRVIEDCLNGRRTVWDDPFKAGRNGLQGLAQRMEIHAPLSLVILMLGTNDFQFAHPYTTATSAGQGIATLIGEIRRAPIEPGMPVPPILVVAPPPIRNPRGAMAAKFPGAEQRSAGLAAVYREVSTNLSCQFFDAGSVTPSSEVDGVHLDAEQHLVLGNALTEVVEPILRAGMVGVGHAG